MLDPIPACDIPAMSPRTAEVRGAVFKLRVVDGGRVDADLVLTLGTPEGVEEWGFDFNYQDVGIRPDGLESPRRELDDFIRSMFDDHMSDLAERGLEPDRRYEDIEIRLEIPDVLLRRTT